MLERKRRSLHPGDRIRVRFGRRLVDGTVTSVRNGHAHVSLDIEGTDGPVGGFYPESSLLPA
ncbi:hypothetical protein [Nocardia sp. NPDC057353]|uniref:hypothetical protein n=1 Tax=Nocardia sp. NPDC057353 TaxID=3346104 RepID=UPI0036340816